jgi:hypothetical protein
LKGGPGVLADIGVTVASSTGNVNVKGVIKPLVILYRNICWIAKSASPSSLDKADASSQEMANRL